MSEAILQFLSDFSYLGVFILMVLENVFPPIPSEVVLPFIGHLAATGELNFFVALVFATLGSVIGTSIWFVVGYAVGTKRLAWFFRHYGGYVAISEHDFAAATRFFTNWQLPAVFFGRMVPGVRSVISIPAGCVHMRLSVFFWYSLFGTLIWNTVLIGLGYIVLDDYRIVDDYVAPIADIIIYAFITLYVVQVIHFVWRKYHPHDTPIQN